MKYNNWFKDNKYTRCYYRILEKPDTSGCTNNHHIIPSAIGGSDAKENRIDISPRQHFICHLLLTKMCIKKKHMYSMTAAANFTAHTSNVKINARTFQTLSEANSERMKEWRKDPIICEKIRQSQIGREFSPEHKQNISNALRDAHKKDPSIAKRMSKGMKKFHAENPGVWMGENASNYGRKFDKSHCERISASLTGRKLSQEHIDKMKATKKATFNEEISKKMRAARVGKVLINNGIESFYCDPLKIPEGFIRGRLHK